MSRAMTRDEFVEFAVFLFGPKWQTPTAEALGIERRVLVRDLAADQSIPENTARIILSLVDGRTAQILEEQRKLIKKIEALKREMNLDRPTRKARDGGREIAS